MVIVNVEWSLLDIMGRKRYLVLPFPSVVLLLVNSVLPVMVIQLQHAELIQ